MDKMIKQIEKFHGHLGPYLVIGYKMGIIANKKLGSDPFTKRAIVWTGTKPPLSCIIDGLQMSSGCTLGKGNIIIRKEGLPQVTFLNNNGNKVEIKLKPIIKREIDIILENDNVQDFSKELYQRNNQEIFDIL